MLPKYGIPPNCLFHLCWHTLLQHVPKQNVNPIQSNAFVFGGTLGFWLVWQSHCNLRTDVTISISALCTRADCHVTLSGSDAAEGWWLQSSTRCWCNRWWSGKENIACKCCGSLTIIFSGLASLLRSEFKDGSPFEWPLFSHPYRAILKSQCFLLPHVDLSASSWCVNFQFSTSPMCMS